MNQNPNIDSGYKDTTFPEHDVEKNHIQSKIPNLPDS